MAEELALVPELEGRRIQECRNKSERQVASKKEGREAGLLGPRVHEEPGWTDFTGGG